MDPMSSSSLRGLVAVSPPLPCSADAFGAGFVRELGTDRALVDVAEPAGAALSWAPRQTLEGRVTIAAVDGRTFTFQAAVRSAGQASSSGSLNRAAHGAREGRVFEVSPIDQQGRAVISDLLNLIRKDQHLTLCASTDVEATDRDGGFGDVVLMPRALPNLCMSEIDTSTTLLGRRFPLPLLITGMTGGLTRGAVLNRRLARAAAEFGIPMGVGSQRLALENPEHAAIFDVKRDVPEVFLIANLGISQLTQTKDPVATCARAVDMIRADALALHVNVLQEAVQVEGDRDFRQVVERIAVVAERLKVPLLVKEVGAGMDVESARTLAAAGVAVIDCGGKGGTSWSWIEGLRAAAPATRQVAETFRDWGIPTAISLNLLSRALPQAALIATGGLRDGLMVAKAVALGARSCGIGLPLMQAALSNDETALPTLLATFADGLRVAMVACGAPSLAHLPARLRITRRFQERLALYGEKTSEH